MKTSNPKIELSFENRILSVSYLDEAVIDEADLKEIYAFGHEKAQGKPYGVIFEALNHYDVTEEAIQYLVDNPYNKEIEAKAYVINTKEAERKTKLHLIFDNPSLKPITFSTYNEAISYLRSILDKQSYNFKNQ